MRAVRTAALAAVLLVPLAGCGSGSGSDDGTVTVTVGYQSKTINTVTAGTLLRSLGYLEEELKALGRRDGVTYKVDWQDYATGAPITAQMTAGKIDIGSMGDFPLLINAARGQQLKADTHLVSVTGYNLRGALNMVVAAPDAKLSSLEQLKGRKVSTSVGSAADGTLIRALERLKLDPAKDVEKLNQQPAVGASALEGGSVEALSQFVAWPGLLVFQDKAKPLYDGGRLDLPTFHGVTVRDSFSKDRPAVVRAFLRAQQRADGYLHHKPLDAAQQVAKATDLPPEVVYLYNGAGGQSSFDGTLKPELTEALEKDAPLLQKAKLIGPVDLDAFVDDSYVKDVYGKKYAAARDAKQNLAPVKGKDPVTGAEVTDQKTASETWWDGEQRTRAHATPSTLLRHVAAQDGKLRAGFVPDALTGTRWFADSSVWAEDPKAGKDDRFQPFATAENARDWIAEHPGARRLSYEDAVRKAGR